MSYQIGLFNVWLCMVAGYGIIWATMVWVDKKRGVPIEDPALYNHVDRRKMMLVTQIPLLALLAISVNMPIVQGPLFWPGMAAAIAGVALNLIAMISFVNRRGGLNGTGIYRFSRNPMYVGGILFVLGLNCIGWSFSVMNAIFSVISLIWVGTIHWTVRKEESFLASTYGAVFDEMRRRVPRYIGLPRR